MVESAGGRWTRRRWLQTSAILVILLVFVGWLIIPGIVRGVVENRVRTTFEEMTGGDVVIDLIEISWGGPQVIQGLQVTTPGAGEVVNLSATIDNGMLPIALSGAPLRVQCGGDLVLTAWPDGGVGFLPPSTEDQPAASSEPVSLGGIPSLDLQVDALSVVIRSGVDGDRILGMKSATASWRTDGTLACDITISSTGPEGDGSARIVGSLASLIDSGGGLTPLAARGAMDVSADQVPLPVAGFSRIESLAMSFKRADAASPLVSTGSCRLLDAAGHAGLVSFDLSSDSAGPSLDGLVGRIAMSDVPAAMLGPLTGDIELPSPLSASISREDQGGLVSMVVDAPNVQVQCHALPLWKGGEELGLSDVQGSVKVPGSLLGQFLQVGVAGQASVMVEAEQIGLQPSVVVRGGRARISGPVTFLDGDATTPLELLSADLQVNASADSSAIDAKGSLEFRQGTARVEGVINNGAVQLRIDSLPTEAIDLVADLEGLLAAALGDTIEFNAQGQPRGDDVVDWVLHLKTPQASLDATLVRDGEAFRTVDGIPVAGQLVVTPRCIGAVLFRLGPGLKDLQSIKDPVTLEISGLNLPLDGDVSKLDATVELVIGEVMIDTRAEAFSILEALVSRAKTAIPARIEPVRFTIANGVMTYDHFVISINKSRIEMTGEVDLNTGRLDMVMDVPINSLGISIKELHLATAAVTGEVRITGTTSNPVIQFKPNFDPTRLLQTPEIGGLIDRLSGEHDLLHGIGGLLNRKRN
ncbi:MAG: AsmA-like C-terminal region-containing protein [Phycisphaerales bacterium]|nr:AsmA-like C-terminal region-containing protein [Phycisphaerales bacterium]